MLNLKQWRKRCEKAKNHGEFTDLDYYDSRNPCKCAIGECAKILKSEYDEIFHHVHGEKFHELSVAELEFMKAITFNDPRKALSAIKKIEQIVDKAFN